MPKRKTALPKKLPLPRFVLVLYALLLLSGVLYLLFRLSTDFSDFFNRYISAAVRALLAALTSWIPFSLAETLLIALPVILIFLIIYAIRSASKSWRSALSYIASLFSVVSLLFTIFVWGFAPGYSGKTVDQKLALDRRAVSARELYETALLLEEEIARLYGEVYFFSDSFSLMPYTYDEMCEKLLDAYDKVSAEHDFIQTLDSRVKPVAMSEWMSYTHITGVYTYFTGEANLNVAFPDYTLPFTAAHELAHQRGIAREDEANFIAFLVCIASDDPYIRYSGYLNMYEYVASALSRADARGYRIVAARLPAEIKAEMKAYSAFFAKYKQSTAGSVSQTINNTYLQAQGTAGTKSYGMVVDLAVAYYRPLLPTE